MLISVSCSRTFYLSTCSSGYKSPDFVIVCWFVLYVKIIHLAGPTWSIVARHHRDPALLLFCTVSSGKLVGGLEKASLRLNYM